MNRKLGISILLVSVCVSGLSLSGCASYYDYVATHSRPVAAKSPCARGDIQREIGGYITCEKGMGTLPSIGMGD